jgi:hypothetical protein
LNKVLPDDGPKLTLTDPRFNRKIGPYKDQPYDGPEQLPSAEDERTLQRLFKRSDWIAAAA